MRPLNPESEDDIEFLDWLVIHIFEIGPASKTGRVQIDTICKRSGRMGFTSEKAI